MLPARRARPNHSQGGFTTVQLLLCVCLTLVMVVWVANLAVYLYGRGVVRSAMDEGARAGSRVEADSVAACEDRAGEVLSNLLGGTMGDGVEVTCTESGGVVRSRAEVTFASWLPPVPAWTFHASGAFLKERSP